MLQAKPYRSIRFFAEKLVEGIVCNPAVQAIGRDSHYENTKQFALIWAGLNEAKN